MSKKYKEALHWAIKAESEQALDATIQRILSAGYTVSDIQQILSSLW